MDKKLVLINQSSGYLMIDICNAFVKSGCFEEIILITGRRDVSVLNLHDNVKIIRSIKYKKDNLFMRLISWFLFLVHSLYIIKFSYRESDLFLVSNPPFNSFIPLFCKNKFSILIYDCYPDILVAQSILKKDNWLVKQWGRVNKYCFSRATKVFTISNKMKQNLQQYINSNNIEIIPLWVHNKKMKPILKCDNQFVKEYSLEQKFIVMYSGNMGYTHDVDVMVDVAILLKDVGDILFLFIGEGAKKKIVETKIRENKLLNCMMLPFQPEDNLPQSISAADIGVVTLDNNSGDLSIPSKTFNYMSVGAIILCIANPNTEIADLVNKNNIGGVFSKENIIGIANFIRDMYNNKEISELYKNKSRALSFLYSPDNASNFVSAHTSKMFIK